MSWQLQKLSPPVLYAKLAYKLRACPMCDAQVLGEALFKHLIERHNNDRPAEHGGEPKCTSTCKQCHEPLHPSMPWSHEDSDADNHFAVLRALPDNHLPGRCATCGNRLDAEYPWTHADPAWDRHPTHVGFWDKEFRYRSRAGSAIEGVQIHCSICKRLALDLWDAAIHREDQHGGAGQIACIRSQSTTADAVAIDVDERDCIHGQPQSFAL